MPKIFISAYACSPFQGSEPGVGWSYVYRLAKFNQVVCCVEEEKFKSDIIKWLALNPRSHMHRVKFVFIRKKRSRRFRKIWPPSYYIFYRRWHWDVYLYVKKNRLHETCEIFHQLTMVGFREPGYLWRLNNPFVWGPVGGFGFFPIRFFSILSRRDKLYYMAYNILNYLDSRFKYRSKSAALKASEIGGFITATSENFDVANKLWKTSSEVIPEVGLRKFEGRKFVTLADLSSRKLKIIWCGKLLPGKAAKLAVRAFAHTEIAENYCLHIIGSGPEFSNLKHEIHLNGIEENVILHGELKRSEVEDLMRSMDLGLITSLRDLTSTVLMEYIEVGMPVICPEHCGFKDIIDNETGFLIPVGNPSQFIDDLVKVLLDIKKNPVKVVKRINKIGEKAQAISLDTNVRRIQEIYENAI